MSAVDGLVNHFVSMAGAAGVRASEVPLPLPDFTHPSLGLSADFSRTEHSTTRLHARGKPGKGHFKHKHWQPFLGRPLRLDYIKGTSQRPRCCQSGRRSVGWRQAPRKPSNAARNVAAATSKKG